MHSTLLQKLTPALAGLLLLVSALPSSGSVTGTSIHNADGSYTYSYVVNNAAGGFDISLWSLDFDFATPDWNQADSFSGGDVTVPDSDWWATSGIPLTGASAQDFLSLSPLSDVLVGATLAGFSFTSWYAPGMVTFSEYDAQGAASSQGTTVGPSHTGTSSVPEGLAPTALLLGWAATGCAWLRRKIAPRHATAG